MTTTVSRILFGSRSEAEGVLLREWCNEAARNGGSFSIEDEWRANQWYQTYTINWPEGGEK